MEAAIDHICRNEGDGAILVFLTGWDEISKLLEKIKANAFLGNSSKFLVLPLHGSMPTVNQREIFDRPPSNMRQETYFWLLSFLCFAYLCKQNELVRYKPNMLSKGTTQPKSLSLS